MSEITKLGTLLDKDARRDAIHVAVAPVIAGQILVPGEHVGWIGEDAPGAVGRVADKIGIVDPFLKDKVLPGQRFYLCLYQQSIQSLRHVWTHPAFEDEVIEPTKDEKRIASEKWLKEYAGRSEGPSYEDWLKLGKTGEAFSENYGDRYGYSCYPGNGYLTSHGSDLYGTIPNEVWDHIENIIGAPVKCRPHSFTCSC